MSKGLRSISADKREKAVLRRLKTKTLGNGYWAAVDYLSKVKKAAKVKAPNA